jgi:ABC-type glycerol-3-phosphate transport system permease component
MIYLSAIFVSLATCLPLIWALISSFKNKTEIFKMPPSFIPEEPTLINYILVLTKTQFLTYFKNSVVVSFAVTIVVLIVATIGAYGLTRFRFPGQKSFSTLILFSYMIPSIILCIPLFFLIVKFGLVNTHYSLILSYITFSLPFSVWVLRDFFYTVPIELEEAVLIDGGNRFHAFFFVALPMGLPGIISVGIFTFILAWNEYLFALIFISSDLRKTLPVGISHLAETVYMEWGMMMAAAILMTIPVLVLFMFILKHLIRGFGAGALKG